MHNLLTQFIVCIFTLYTNTSNCTYENNCILKTKMTFLGFEYLGEDMANNCKNRFFKYKCMKYNTRFIHNIEYVTYMFIKFSNN